MCCFDINRFRRRPATWDDTDCRAFECRDILPLHQSLEEYAPTPLVPLPNLARKLGLREIIVKDESHRFGLNAFKALGATYAVYRFLSSESGNTWTRNPPERFYSGDDFIPTGRYTFCTATDGNHGRGVAWVAGKLQQRSVIYMPRDSVQSRIENIKSEGADVVVIDGNYDDAVQRCAVDAENNGWQIIADTSWPGYHEIPRWIMAGYTSIFREIDDVPRRFDTVIIQGGVGALAAAAAWYYNSSAQHQGIGLVSVEPTDADCLLESISSPDGKATSSKGFQQSIMAGLNCGTPSEVSWPFIRSGFDLFVSIPDRFAEEAMRAYFHPAGNDSQIVSGESGAAGLGALMAIMREDSLATAREFIRLGPESSVLLLNTEGDTDPVNFRKITGV